MPYLKGVGRGIAAALVHRTVVAAAARMRIDAVRLAVGDVDMASIRPPAWLACGKMLVGISDAGVMFLAILILRRVRIGIATQPELLDELIPLLVIAQALESLQLLVGDNPADILIDPLLVLALQLVAKRLVLRDFF